MHQLQHEEVGLQREGCGQRGVARGGSCWPTLLSQLMHRQATAAPPRAVRSPHPHLSVKLTVYPHQYSTMASLLKQLFERPLSAPCLQHPLVSYAGST